MRGSRIWVGTVAAGLLAATMGVAGCSSDEDDAKDALEAFLAGWPTGALDEVPFVTPTGEPVGSAEVAGAIGALSGELAEQPPGL
ncbi:MAG: hypothetical protein ACRDT2_11290, partial [Natronosporangium sp.]